MKYALRQLRRTPGFTALVVLTLALGIGASTAIFSVVQSAVLSPLDLPEPDRLVRMWAFDTERNFHRATMSYMRFDYLRERQEAFEDVAASSDTYTTLTGRGQAEQLAAKLVSSRFFSVLHTRPLIGRAFLDSEDRPGARKVTMISERLWRRVFAGSDDALGEVLILDGKPHTVVGVVPASFGYPDKRTDIWITGVETPSLYSEQQVRDGAAYLNLTARLKPGVTLLEAVSEVRRVAGGYRREFNGRIDATSEIEVISFEEELVGQQRQSFYLLLGAVGLVHLIACFNVANLLLARFAARGRENAMRIAMGATRGQLIGQFIAETMLLSLGAGMVGAVFASWLLDAFAAALSEVLPLAGAQGVSMGALGFMLALTVLTGLMLGWFPGALSSRRDVVTLLKASARGATAGLRAGTFRRAVLVAQVAISLVLLIAAGLVALSFGRLRATDLGYRASGLFMAEVELPRISYNTPAKQVAVAQQLLDDLATLPGVRSATITDSPPLRGGPVLSPYSAADRPLPPMAERLIALRNVVSPGFFAAMGIPVVAGRDFAPTDKASTPSVAILNRTMALRLFGEESPLGKRVVLGVTDRTVEVIGIVGDIRVEAVATPPKPEIYFSFLERPRVSFTLLLRTDDEPGVVAPSVRAVLRQADRDIPLINARSMAEEVGRSLASQRTSLALLGLFAGTALVLAALGIYSVMAYLVLQRTGEISIRLLLGAKAQDVRRLILIQGARLTAIGLILGLAGAMFVRQLMHRILYGVPAVHLTAYFTLAAFLGTVSLAACWLAARRATKVDPRAALRAE